MKFRRNKGTDPGDDASNAGMAAQYETVTALPDPVADRAALIQLCIYALDRARSPGVTERIEAGLADIGVVALRPDGARFDPAVHEAGGVVPTTEASLDGLVAETEVAGFSDRGVVLRVPIVTVYALQA